MRVESTDALSMNLDRLVNNSGTANERKQIEDTMLQNKKISQMTEFDKQNLPIGEKVLISAIEKANKALTGSTRYFERSVHEKTKDIIVKVIDSETDEVVREIPPEKILDLVSRLLELAGLIVDERR
ncbi:MAG TPA: flagellar protein FlaG [Clostridiaceae bacterium]|nr:flagellar protein FlaG [Clostridiaceae bacterium]